MKKALIPYILLIISLFACNNTHQSTNNQRAKAEHNQQTTINDTILLKKFFELPHTKLQKQYANYLDTSSKSKTLIRNYIDTASLVSKILSVEPIMTYKTYFNLYLVQALTKSNKSKNLLVKIDVLDHKIISFREVPNNIPVENAEKIILKQLFSAHLDTIPSVIQDRDSFQVQSLGSTSWPLNDTIETYDKFFTKFGQSKFVTFKFTFLDLYQEWKQRPLERWFWIFYYVKDNNRLIFKNLECFYSEEEATNPLVFDIINLKNYDFLYKQETIYESDKYETYTTYKDFIHPSGIHSLWLKDIVLLEDNDTVAALTTEPKLVLENNQPYAIVKLRAINKDKKTQVCTLKFKFDYKTNTFVPIDSLSKKNLDNIQNDTLNIFSILH